MLQQTPKDLSARKEDSKSPQKMSVLMNQSNLSVMDVMEALDDLPEKRTKKAEVKGSGKKQTKL